MPEQVDQRLKEKKALKRRDGIHIDLEELGYDKLLGSGQATRPFIIKIASYSGVALEKIEKAKGRILEAKH